MMQEYLNNLIAKNISEALINTLCQFNSSVLKKSKKNLLIETLGKNIEILAMFNEFDQNFDNLNRIKQDYLNVGTDKKIDGFVKKAEALTCIINVYEKNNIQEVKDWQRAIEISNIFLMTMKQDLIKQSYVQKEKNTTSNQFFSPSILGSPSKNYNAKSFSKN